MAHPLSYFVPYSVRMSTMRGDSRNLTDIGLKIIPSPYLIKIVKVLLLLYKKITTLLVNSSSCNYTVHVAKDRAYFSIIIFSLRIISAIFLSCNIDTELPV